MPSIRADINRHNFRKLVAGVLVAARGRDEAEPNNRVVSDRDSNRRKLFPTELLSPARLPLLDADAVKKLVKHQPTVTGQPSANMNHRKSVCVSALNRSNRNGHTRRSLSLQPVKARSQVQLPVRCNVPHSQQTLLALGWRRGELNPRPRSRKRWRLRA